MRAQPGEGAGNMLRSPAYRISGDSSGTGPGQPGGTGGTPKGGTPSRARATEESRPAQRIRAKAAGESLRYAVLPPEPPNISYRIRAAEGEETGSPAKGRRAGVLIRTRPHALRAHRA